MSAIKAPDVMTMCECCAAVYVFESPSCELEPVLTPLQKSKWSGFNDIFLIFLYFFCFISHNDSCEEKLHNRIFNI